MKSPTHNILNQHNPTLLNRRQFLCATSAGVAAFHLLPGNVAQGAERLAASDKLNVAGIGIGGQGGSDIDAVAGEGQNLVALCDVDDEYAAKKFTQYPKARQFKWDNEKALSTNNEAANAYVAPAYRPGWSL